MDTVKTINLIMNGNPMTAIAAAQKALEVGDRMVEGTVCFHVDLENNRALFVSEKIFNGIAKFDEQGNVIERVNEKKLHGYDDWCNITDDMGGKLAEAWDKVAPPELKGKDTPWFWIASSFDNLYGYVRRGGETRWNDFRRDSLHPVSVVRSASITPNLR